MEMEEEDDTNDEDFTVEIRQFSSCSHRFSKVSEMEHQHAESWEDCPWLVPSSAGLDCQGTFPLCGVRSPALKTPR